MDSARVLLLTLVTWLFGTIGTILAILGAATIIDPANENESFVIAVNTTNAYTLVIIGTLCLIVALLSYMANLLASRQDGV
jgi:uncharacterized membrane protein